MEYLNTVSTYKQRNKFKSIDELYYDIKGVLYNTNHIDKTNR